MASAKKISSRKKESAIKAKRKKKKWFTLLAPEVYGKSELSEITAFDPKALLNRTIELSSKDLGVRDMGRKFLLKINKIQGETAETKVVKAFIMDNTLQRKSRKIKEKMVYVFNVTLNSNELMRFKILLNTTKHIARSTKSSLTNSLPVIVKQQVGKKGSQDIFASGYLSKLALEIKKHLKTIYPISHVYVWKATLVD